MGNFVSMRKLTPGVMGLSHLSRNIIQLNAALTEIDKVEQQPCPPEPSSSVSEAGPDGQYYENMVLDSVQVFGAINKELPGTIAQKIKSSAIHWQTIDKPADVTLVQAGEINTTIWIILKGCVDVLTTIDNEEVILNSLECGQCFGEISVLFQIPATASVMTTTECSFLVITNDQIERLITVPLQANMKIEWCAANHYYLPIPGVRAEALHLIIALDFLRMVPLFESWGKSALKVLLSMVDGSKITFHKRDHIIMSKEKVATTIHIVIAGTVILTGKDSDSIVIRVRDEPFVCGLHGLFLDEVTNNYNSLIAQTNCQVISIEYAHVQETVEEMGDLCLESWGGLNNRWKEFRFSRLEHTGNYPELSYPWTYAMMRFSQIFSACSAHFINLMVLCSVLMVCTEGNETYSLSDNQNKVLLFVLSGEYVMRTENEELFDETDKILHAGKGFLLDDSISHIVIWECVKNGTVLKIDRKRCTEALMKYPDCSIKTLQCKHIDPGTSSQN